MIVEKIVEAKKRKIKQLPILSNRASELGNPCVRYHVLNRTRWQEKSLHDVGLQFVFDLGSEIEQIALKELAEAGIIIYEQQRAFEWKEYQITGHVDGFIMPDPTENKTYPLEIKSMSPYVWQNVNNIGDMMHGRYPYLRKYSAQLNLYMLMKGIDKGVFLLKNKVTGAYKEIWMNLDYDLGEKLLQRAEAINRHVAAGTLPDPIDNDLWCEQCPFRHICLPEHIGQEVEIDTTDLAVLLDRMEQIKPMAKEYEEIDNQVKEMVKGREKILAGNWFITGKWVEKKAIQIPASRYWKKSVKKVEV